MDVRDLSREQLVELKCDYMTELTNEGIFAEIMNRDYDSPSYWDLANADEFVSDEVIFEHYSGTDFVNDDFFCTADI